MCHGLSAIVVSLFASATVHRGGGGRTASHYYYDYYYYVHDVRFFCEMEKDGVVCSRGTSCWITHLAGELKRGGFDSII